ncbi:hypothetical protein SAMN02745671_00069 [Anaerovibrio lipolyticus DSM 3074]|uniref:Zinc-or iron-chelating domain-containing protein n=1 Tax=Anaerovibrio lipolyticus DSM 3074 TaxID=1120997 RepID=A0A1M5ZYL8_9FIRM|nr:hypothetical protein SAMN02745671_00069 [Anaerovibrio lipolyticus DSM 3074]
MCKYYDAQQKLCSIYDERPIICNVDMYYEANLKGKIDRDTYYNTNYVVCEKLKSTIINK